MSGQEVVAKGQQIVTFGAKIFRGKGGLYLDYVDKKGKMIPWPGGEWHQGREGRFFERDLVRRVDKFNRWMWLWLRCRMEFQEIKLFVLAIIRRRLK